jgi:hypothetical protein
MTAHYTPPTFESEHLGTSSIRTIYDTLTTKKHSLEFLPIARTPDLYSAEARPAQTMVLSWKSFLSLYCGCGPLHEDDVELRNMRPISGPLVSIPTYRARAYKLNHPSLSRTSRARRVYRPLSWRLPPRSTWTGTSPLAPPTPTPQPPCPPCKSIWLSSPGFGFSHCVFPRRKL